MADNKAEEPILTLTITLGVDGVRFQATTDEETSRLPNAIIDTMAVGALEMAKAGLMRSRWGGEDQTKSGRHEH
jgi:hypothetical protein